MTHLKQWDKKGSIVTNLCGGGDAACRCRYCSYSLFFLVAVVVTCDGICGFESAFHTSGRGGSDCAQQLAVLLAHCVRSTAFRLAIFIRLRPVARQSGARPTFRVSINRSRRHAVNINKSLVYLERCTAVYRVVLSLSAVSNGRYLGPQPSQVLFDKKLHDDLIVDFYFYGHLSALYLFIFFPLFS